MKNRFAISAVLGLALFPALSLAQSLASPAELRLHIVSTHPRRGHAAPAVVWLKPVPGTAVPIFLPHGHYSLLQKNRTFLPHLQAIPVGSVVQFPNDDPFFHNVFSLFDGKRFDLGLYEAGSSKSVTFSREGVSYIFCNIHPEMSAVIISLSTPLYAISNADGTLVLRNVPPGTYQMHLWVEGVPQSVLSGLTRSVTVTGESLNLGEIRLPIGTPPSHDNKYGRPYQQLPASPY